MPEVRTFTAAGQTIIEVDAEPGGTLDSGWRVRFAAAARDARAPYFGVAPAHCAARVPTDRAGRLLALAAELAPITEPDPTGETDAPLPAR